jgi:hypothetical protein
VGASKTPFFAYVDESGNTGKNIFDAKQPDFFTAAVVTKGDFDVGYGSAIRAVANRLCVDAIHASELGFDGLERIADDLGAILFEAQAHFHVSRVEKSYLLATKMFDILFDSGENAAVAWHHYNIRPLRIMLAFKLAAIIDDDIARQFWDCLLLPKEEDARAKFPEICAALKVRLDIIPDERSREVLGEGLDWIIKHPTAIHLVTERKLAKQGHFPNLVAFGNLLQGLQILSQRYKKKVARITHDEQSEFSKTLTSWHEMFSNARPDVVRWGGDDISIQMIPGSEFVIKADSESPGIQMADVALWLYAQSLKGKILPPGCERLLALVLHRGWHTDFSFQGVHDQMMERWGEGELMPEQLEAAKRLVQESEQARLVSMAQFEKDGLLPFMRSLPSILPKVDH